MIRGIVSDPKIAGIVTSGNFGGPEKTARVVRPDGRIWIGNTAKLGEDLEDPPAAALNPQHARDTIKPRNKPERGQGEYDDGRRKV